MTGHEFIYVALIILFASCIQGVAGIGFGTIAGSMTALIAPHFMPVGILLVGIVPSAWVAYRDREGLKTDEVAYYAIGAIPGAIAGAYMSYVLPEGHIFQITIALVVLLSIATSTLIKHLSPNPLNLSIAGLLSGSIGTATALGGAPVAIVYQNGHGKRVRATMSACFVLYGVVGFGCLAASNQVAKWQLELALPLLITASLGLYLSKHLLRYVPPERAGKLALALSTVAATILLVVAVIGVLGG